MDEIAGLAESNPEFLKGFYEDIHSVVLRSKRDSYAKNDYLTKQLASLIGGRRISKPIVISGLRIREDNDSAYGLSFEKADNFNFFEAPELANCNHNRKFSRFDERGMPTFNENGNKTLYTRDNGVSRLYFSRDLNLYSGSEGLACSDGDGRVVVVSAVGAAKNLEVYINNAKQARKNYIIRLNTIKKQIDEELKSG